MNHAILLSRHGGPEVLEWVEVPVPAPGPGEVLVRQTAIGLNFIDTYVRSGVYTMLQLPGTPGMEAAGMVEAAGEGVEGFAPGDRVAYVWNVPGAYAELRAVPAGQLVKLPEFVDDRTAAALMLKGLTAAALLTRTTRAAKGDTVLVHAAAGGVGSLLVRWAKQIGCKVIATVGSEGKTGQVLADGADHVLLLDDTVRERVAEITGGAGCRYVYDGIGKDTFQLSLDVIGKFGHLVSFGNASGVVPPISIACLAPKALALSRPMLFPYISDRSGLEALTVALFDMVRAGVATAKINQTYPLREAAQAHRDLESRRTTGQTVLLP